MLTLAKKLRALILALLISAVVVIPASASTDTIAAAGLFSGNDAGIVWVNTDVGYMVYASGVVQTAADLVWTKTVDGGANWSVEHTIQADVPTTTCETAPALSVWYDRWTSGDAGTKIHIAWHHNSDTGSSCSNSGTDDSIKYASLDTASDTLSSVVSTAITAYGGQCYQSSNPCNISITKNASGYLYIHAQLTTSSFQERLLQSTNGGASWNAKTIWGHVGTILPSRPLTGITDSGVWGFGVDEQVYKYSSVTNMWTASTDFSSDITGSACATGAGASLPCYSRAIHPNITTGYFQFFSLRTSNGIWIIAEDYFTTDWFIRAQPVTGGSQASISYDSNNQVLYATWLSGTDVTFSTSEDDGVSWSASSVFSDNANTKNGLFTTPNFTPSGARWLPAWRDSVTTGEIDTNLANGEDLSSPSPDNSGDFDPRLTRFVDGLGLVGDTGKTAFAAICGLLLVSILFFRAPVIVFLSLELCWFGAMAAVRYITTNLFLGTLVVFGVWMIFALIARFTIGRSGEDF